MKYFFYFVNLLIVLSCQTKQQKINSEVKKSILSDSSIKKIAFRKDKFNHGFVDSLNHAKIDTFTISGKRDYLLRNSLIENFAIEYDTLFDITYDGHNDYIIGYYGLAGTGFKHHIRVFLYEDKDDCYHYNEQLSAITNPSFFISEKFITEFYIGLGAGYGSKLEWTNGRWVKTKEFNIENNGGQSVWKIFYPLQKIKDSLQLPFQMIPPPEVLRIDKEKL